VGNTPFGGTRSGGFAVSLVAQYRPVVADVVVQDLWPIGARIGTAQVAIGDRRRLHSGVAGQRGEQLRLGLVRHARQATGASLGPKLNHRPRRVWGSEAVGSRGLSRWTTRGSRLHRPDARTGFRSAEARSRTACLLPCFALVHLDEQQPARSTAILDELSPTSSGPRTDSAVARRGSEKVVPR
jgi:hypothetical protein